MIFLPELALIICGYASTWRLLSWVEELMKKRKQCLTGVMHCLWANPRGLDECLDRCIPLNWEKLCLNPHPWAVEQMLGPQNMRHKALCHDNMIRNPGLEHWIELKTDYWSIANNPSDRTTKYVISQLKDDPIKFDSWISMLSLNSNDLAVDFILERIPLDNILGSAWSNSNPRMFKLLTENYPETIAWTYLSLNKLPGAIELLKNNPKQIHWCSFLMNPGIFSIWSDPGLLAALTCE